jgi:hypothetical protein
LRRRWDRLVFRGRPESRKFLGFYLNDGVVRARSVSIAAAIRTTRRRMGS